MAAKNKEKFTARALNTAPRKKKQDEKEKTQDENKCDKGAQSTKKNNKWCKNCFKDLSVLEKDTYIVAREMEKELKAAKQA